MYIIKTKQDIDVLIKANVIQKQYMDIIENNFKHQYEVLKEDDKITLEEFSLNNDGEIVVLEKGDNLRNLQAIGLDPKAGLLSSTPESIKRIIIEERILFEIIILCNNQYVLYIYVPKDILDDEILDLIIKKI